MSVRRNSVTKSIIKMVPKPVGKKSPEIEPSEKTKWGMNKWGMKTTRKDRIDEIATQDKMGDEQNGG